MHKPLRDIGGTLAPRSMPQGKIIVADRMIRPGRTKMILRRRSRPTPASPEVPQARGRLEHDLAPLLPNPACKIRLVSKRHGEIEIFIESADLQRFLTPDRKIPRHAIPHIAGVRRIETEIKVLS